MSHFDGFCPRCYDYHPFVSTSDRAECAKCGWSTEPALVPHDVGDAERDFPEVVGR